MKTLLLVKIRCRGIWPAWHLRYFRAVCLSFCSEYRWIAFGAYAFRMFGGAIFAMGFACWLARDASESPAARALIMAMLLFDAVFVALLLSARLAAGLTGIALWPTAVLRLGLAGFLSLFCLRRSSVARVG